MAKIIRTGGNGRYSACVNNNGVLYLAGQVGDDMTGDIKKQTAETLAAIEEILAANGSDKEHILQATVYIKNMALFRDMNAVWDAWVAKGNEPARACVEAAMFSPMCLVEITVVAAVK